MPSNESRDPARHHQALIRSSAQRRAELLKELQAERERERTRHLEADAAKTARLRALRLAREAQDAVSAAVLLKGVRAQP